MYRMNGKRVGRPILLLDVCREFRSPKRWISLFTPLSSLPLVLQARLSFFPRYYLVSTPLCHGSTKFEAFIECLRTENRPQPPPRLQASFSLSLSHSVPISFSLAPPLLVFLFVHFSQQLSSFLAPVYISDESVGKRVHRDATRTEFSVCFSLGYSGLRSRPRFSVQRYTSVRRARLCTRCSRYFAVIRGEEERERGSEAARPRALIASPVTQYVVYSSNFLFVAFRSRTC